MLQSLIFTLALTLFYSLTTRWLQTTGDVLDKLLPETIKNKSQRCNKQVNKIDFIPKSK